METSDIIAILVQFVLPIVVTVGGFWFKHQLASRLEGEQRTAALAELDLLVESGVKWAQQEFVGDQKAGGTFDAKAKSDARQKVILEVLNTLSKQSYEALKRAYPDRVEDVVALHVEKHVVNMK